MKVLVTGSRDWPYDKRHIINRALINAGATIVIQGEQRGADRLAKWEAIRREIPVRGYPADWTTYGNAAGPIRNQEMLDKEHTVEEPIDEVLAFPMEASVGTWDMVARAKRAGIPVTIIEGD
nr:protein of unknown function (DUF2493) [uncultured bacterium]